MHAMELLPNLGHVESCFRLFGDCISVGARYVHGLRQTHHRLINHFGCTRWYAEVTRLKWRLVLVRLEVVRILTQDRCMVCTECTIGSENICDAPDGTPS